MPAASESASAEKNTVLAEMLELRQPNVTQIAYWEGDKLIQATTPNPCPLEAGVFYSLTEIKAVSTVANAA